MRRGLGLTPAPSHAITSCGALPQALSSARASQWPTSLVRSKQTGWFQTTVRACLRSPSRLPLLLRLVLKSILGMAAAEAVVLLQGCQSEIFCQHTDRTSVSSLKRRVWDLEPGAGELPARGESHPTTQLVPLQSPCYFSSAGGTGVSI